MRTRAALPLLFVLSAFVASAQGDDKKEPPKAAKNAALEQFKQLAGEWVGMHEGQETRVRYKVTAGGSAVVETIMPDSDHEMITVIHPDGNDLILTHYCMLGNQPQMRAKNPGDAKDVAFKFTGATNLKSDKEMHMHDVTYTFVDKDTLKAEWTHFNDGKSAGKVVFEVKRKK